VLFNSVQFAIFLPLVFLLYWQVAARNLQWRNAFLLVVSYLFYGWWDWRFLILLSGSSAIDFGVARWLEKADEARRPWILSISLVANLGTLGFFKYYNFFADSAYRVLTHVGLEVSPSHLNVLLPVGISFYTFQELAYTIDVYRRRMPACQDPLAFAAYVGFFPQLVAGPIEAPRELLHQFGAVAPFNPKQASDGIRQMLWGFFKKMVIADNCAAIVDGVFADYATQSGYQLLAGAFFFSFQIYADFSGYSDIAGGVAKLLGFRLSVNFRTPYLSRNIAEFWRRWHVSLMTWFRTYVYIPLGGSRGGRWFTARNVLLVFVISGLWHGANWTYVAWGAINGLLFVPLVLRDKTREFVDPPSGTFPSLRELWQMMSTFAVVTLSWVFFRSPTIEDAVAYLLRLLDTENWRELPATGELRYWLPMFALIGVLLGCEWIQRHKDHVLELEHLSIAKRWAIYQLIVVSLFFFGVFGAERFIYFQF
jgi:alginate O-acetyltransferase complex protein AlgI